MERSYANLASGKRINVASDDAAGVAISSRLSAEIRGTDQAIRNAIDGQALLDIAEGVHQEVQNILQRMREITVQSANDTNNQQDRDNLQAEMNHMINEIDRISSTTTWTGTSLIDNLADTKFSLQVGTSALNSDQVDISISSLSSTSLGLAVSPISEPVSISEDGTLNYQAANGGAFAITTAEGTTVSISARASDASDAEYAGAVAADINRGTGNALPDLLVGNAAAPRGESGHGIGASINGDGSNITLSYTGAITRVEASGVMEVPSKVLIFSDSIQTSEFTIKGLGTDGQALTETLSGIQQGIGFAGSNVSTGSFSSIESITSSADTTGNVVILAQDNSAGQSSLGLELVAYANLTQGIQPLLSGNFVNKPGFQSSGESTIDALTFETEPVSATLSSVLVSSSGYQSEMQEGQVTDQLQGILSTERFHFPTGNRSKYISLNNQRTIGQINLTGTNTSSGLSETIAVTIDYTNEASTAKSAADINNASYILNLGYVAMIGDAADTLTHGGDDTGKINLVGSTTGNGGSSAALNAGPGGLPEGFSFAADPNYGMTLEARAEVAATSDGNIDANTGVFTLAAGKQTAIMTLAAVDVAVSGLKGDGGSVDAGAIALAVNNSNDAHRFTAKANDDGTVTIKPPVDPTSVADGTESRESTAAIDNALKIVATQRVELGAVSKSLNHTIDNLTNMSVNLSQARGGIEDADFALETMQLAKAQILQQASTAMLAQSNASKQNVLSLF